MADLETLRPSSLARVIACPGSRRLAAKMPPQPSSSYADEGTAAHALAEMSLRQGRAPFEWWQQEIEVNGKGWPVTSEMVRAVCTYVAAVNRDRREHRGAKVELEKQVYLADINNSGTVDCAIIYPDGGYLGVRDYKHGSGVYVSEVWNAQMLAYALAVWNIYFRTVSRPLSTVKVEATVHQPRFPDVAPARTHTMTAADLLRWRDETLRPAIAASEAEDAPVNAGDHCIFCPAKTACIAYLTRPKKPYRHVPVQPGAATLPPNFSF